MSSAAPGRLTALGWRSLRIQTRTIPRHSGSPAAAVVARRPATEPCRWNSSSFKRRGKAIEPATTPADTTVATDEATPPVEQQQQQQAAEPRVESTVKSIVKTDAPLKTEQTAEELKNSHAHKATGDSDQQADSFSSSSSSSSEVSSANKPATEPTDTTDRTPKQEAGGPLDKVLSDVQPNKGPTSRSGRYHPHMSPPPYVHHFDSYSLVKQLQDGGYTPTQAIEAMKGIRALLAQNLDVAQDELVSKSDVENESYLFRAACSELGQGIRNNRRLQDEQIRQQRTLLQHEVDILTQSLNQEVSTLNDNVRGMFNDRRMAVREEQKTADSAVQQINYKISTSLGSDSKSEIEGVRWILIRRSALGIFLLAMLTLGTLRFATYQLGERQKAAERKKTEDEMRRKDAGKNDHSSAADAAAILAAN